MRYLLLAAAVVLLSGPGAPADDKDAKADLGRLTGTWVGVAVTQDGKELSKAEAEAVRLVVRGEAYALKMGDQDIEGTHKLDPSKTPKEIDAVRTKGPHKGEKMLGIYELTSDSFKVCLAAPGKDRPAALKSAAGSGTRLYVFKREKK